jgi:hypothetical protein
MDIQLTEKPDTSRHDLGLNMIRVLILAFAALPILPICSIFMLPNSAEATANESFLVITQLFTYAGMALAFILLPILIVIGLVIRSSRQKLTGKPYPVRVFILGGVLWLIYAAGAILLGMLWFT